MISKTLRISACIVSGTITSLIAGFLFSAVTLILNGSDARYLLESIAHLLPTLSLGFSVGSALILVTGLGLNRLGVPRLRGFAIGGLLTLVAWEALETGMFAPTVAYIFYNVMINTAATLAIATIDSWWRRAKPSGNPERLF